jgi:NTE family protein
MTALGDAIDIFRVRNYFVGLTQMRDVGREVRDDAAFLARLRRAVFRLPLEPAPAPRPVVWEGRVRPLRRKLGRLGIAATGGSGALASLVGVVKACEEVGVTPDVMSFASGAALFAFPLAAGRKPDEVADFVLRQDPSAWVDPDWLAVGAVLPKQGRGFTGVMKGQKLEDSYREFLGDIRVGDLAIPAYSPVWNVEHNRLEYIGPRTHPDVPVARAIRMSVALPLFFDPVRWRGGSWNDGAIVDIFPVHPILDIEPPCDVVLTVNCFYPPEFAGEDATGFRDNAWSVMDIADQVVTAPHLQLARENLARLRRHVPSVLVTNPVPYTMVRRAGFYAEFIDRSAWPSFMQWGRTATLRALNGLGSGQPGVHNRIHRQRAQRPGAVRGDVRRQPRRHAG